LVDNFSELFFQSSGSEYYIFLKNELGRKNEYISEERTRHSYFRDLRQKRGSTKIPKTVLKTRLKTTYTLVFVKYLVVSFQGHSIRANSVFLERSLKIISGT
jgi:hypothetical protein